jgi:F0F1-type ATP synthase assembly protein I
MVGWVLAILAVIVIAGTVVGVVSGWFADRMAEIVDPF